MVKTINILEVARGAIMEQIDIELRKVVENLQDPNTNYKPNRELNIKVIFKNLDERRDKVGLAAQAKAKLEPNMPIGTMLFSELTADGVVIAEADRPDRDQITFDDMAGTTEQKVIRLPERKEGRACSRRSLSTS